LTKVQKNSNILTPESTESSSTHEMDLEVTYDHLSVATSALSRQCVGYTHQYQWWQETMCVNFVDDAHVDGKQWQWQLLRKW